jgi:hypothetical protein
MTQPIAPAPNTEGVPDQPWWARPRIVLSLLTIGVIVAALMTRTAVNGRSGDQRLTTTSAEPMGAKLLYELVGRMGYSAKRINTKIMPADSLAIVAVLDPVVELDGADVHRLMNHVRAGGALLTVLGRGTRVLSDSLNVTIDVSGSGVRTEASLRPCARVKGDTSSVIGFVNDVPLGMPSNGLWIGLPTLYALKIPDSLRTNMRSFVQVDSPAISSARRREATPSLPSVVGIPYGRGHVVIASDPDTYRNDALRECRYGLDAALVDAMEYLSYADGANRRTMYFDEYHQRRSVVRSDDLVAQYLTRQPTGRMVLQCSIAAFVLLLGAMPRVLRPREDRMLERRSPLEHVDALARAYVAVGATRTGVQRLVRGLQRQLSGRTRNTSLRNDEEFLARLAETKPALKSDIDSIRHALNNRVSASQFLEVGHALQRVRTAISRT